MRCSTSITLDAWSFAKPRRSSECFLLRMIPEVFLEDGGASPLYQIMKLPIKFIGVGEAPDDLQPFDADTFVESLFT